MNTDLFKSVVCPACNAQVGQPCTNPTSTGRSPSRRIHFARVDLVVNPPQTEEKILPTRSAFEEIGIPELQIPADLAKDEWSTRVLNEQLDIHDPCGTILIPGHRALHETYCRAQKDYPLRSDGVHRPNPETMIRLIRVGIESRTESAVARINEILSSEYGLTMFFMLIRENYFATPFRVFSWGMTFQHAADNYRTVTNLPPRHEILPDTR